MHVLWVATGEPRREKVECSARSLSVARLCKDRPGAACFQTLSASLTVSESMHASTEAVAGRSRTYSCSFVARSFKTSQDSLLENSPGRTSYDIRLRAFSFQCPRKVFRSNMSLCVSTNFLVEVACIRRAAATSPGASPPLHAVLSHRCVRAGRHRSPRSTNEHS